MVTGHNSGLCPDPPLVGEAGKETTGSFPGIRVIRVIPSRAARAQAPSVLPLDSIPAPLCSKEPEIQFFKLIRRHIVAMAVYADGIVKSFNVFKHESMGMLKVQDLETVQPLTFDNRVKGFNTGIVIRITFMTVTKLELLCNIAVGFGNILAATI